MYKPTYITLKPKAGYIGIGEDHAGAYSFNFNNTVHTDALLDLIGKKNSIVVWYEGATSASISKSYKNFLSDLKTFLSKNQISINIRSDGWELSIPRATPEIEYPAVILGPDISWVKQQLSPYLNKNYTMADAIARSKKFYDRNPPISTKEHVINALTESNGTQSNILKMMLEPNSANDKVMNEIWGGGYKALRASYFEGTPGAYSSSSIYKNVDKFNSRRDNELSKKMKFKGGIFLAGDGHIQLMIEKYRL